MKTLALMLPATLLTVVLALPALADKGKLSDSDRAEILALTDKVETAIINKDLKLLQECCDPYAGLMIDAGFGIPIYFGWDQVPLIVRNNWLYFLGNADGSGFPVYGRAREIIWEGSWQVRGVFEPTDSPWRKGIPWIRSKVSLSEIMQNNDGQELDSLTVEPSNMLFAWQDEYNFVQYFFAGEDRDPQVPHDNQFWFLLFDTRAERAKQEWCLSGIAHLDGWGI